MPSPSTHPTSISIPDLARMLEIEPPAEAAATELTGVATIRAAGPQDVTFLANDRYANRLKDSQAGAVLVAEDYDGTAPMPMLRSPQPRLAFAKLLAFFHPAKPRKTGVHATAVVPESCTLGEDVYVAPYVVLGENVRLGDRVSIHAHSVVEDDVTIGDDSELRSHVSVRDGTVIGKRSVIQDGAILGSDGFGFEPLPDGSLHKVPQVGTVTIGDDVEIQAGACVDRAALGVTSIGDGTKIDNLTQVGHNCIVGKHVIMCAQVGLSGSTTIDDHVMLGGQVGFAGHTVAGAGAKVVAQSGIMKDLEPNKIYAGTPAYEFKDMFRAATILPQLPNMMRRLKKLERAAAEAAEQD